MTKGGTSIQHLLRRHRGSGSSTFIMPGLTGKPAIKQPALTRCSRPLSFGKVPQRVVKHPNERWPRNPENARDFWLEVVDDDHPAMYSRRGAPCCHGEEIEKRGSSVFDDKPFLLFLCVGNRLNRTRERQRRHQSVCRASEQTSRQVRAHARTFPFAAAVCRCQHNWSALPPRL